MRRGKQHIGTIDPAALDDPRLYTEVVTPDSLLSGEKPLKANERRMIVHSKPVWYVDDQGNAAEISTLLEEVTEDGAPVWKADANTLQFRVRDDGVCVYRAVGHRLRVRPSRIHLEDSDNVESGAIDQIKPTLTAKQGSRVIQHGSFPGVRIEHEVVGGTIKEIAWLDTKPKGLGGKRFVALIYQYESQTLAPVNIDGDIHWQASGTTVMRWPAPVVTDANGKTLRAQYRLRDGFVGLLVMAADLRKASYPVAIDPTTTTGSSDATATRSTRSSGSSGSANYKQMFNKIVMPDLTGYYAVDAEFHVYCNVSGGAVDVDVYAAATGAWDTSSSYSTLEALATGTAIDTGVTVAAGVGWKYIDIFGSGLKGVNKFYDDDITGGDLTVALDWADWASTLGAESTTGRIGDSGGIQEYGIYNDATYYPRIEVTYSSTPPADATASGDLSLGGLTLAGTVPIDTLASGNLSLGGLTVSGVIAPSVVASGDLSLGGLTLAGVFGADSTASGDLSLGGLTLTGTVGDGGHEAAGNLSLGGLSMGGYALSVSPGTTTSDGLRAYLTGAVEAGEPQRDPVSSTAGFRSGVPFVSLEWDMPDPMIGILILDASGTNGPGVGTLIAPTSGSLTWQPPSGTEGAAVTIANGAEVILYGTDVTKWLRVKRTSAVPLSGAKAVYLVDIYNNLLPDVASADAIAGLATARALMLHNEVAGTVVNVRAWIADSDGDISIAFETPTAGELLGAGLSFSSPTTQGAALNAGALFGLAELGLHIKRTVAASTDPSPSTLWAINLEFTDTAQTYTVPIRGRYRIARNDYVGQGIWIGTGGDDPDFEASPDEVWTSNPNTTSLSLASDETYRVAVRSRNPWGLWGVPTDIEEFVIDASGDGVLSPPSAPTDISASQTSGNKPSVSAQYDAAADGDTLRAALWVIWLETDGTDPDGTVTPDGYSVMQFKGAVDDLVWDSTSAALDDGTPISALIRTRRLDNAGTAFQPDTIQLDDTNPGTLKVTGEITDWPASGYGRTYSRFGRLLEVWSYSGVVAAGGFTTVTVDARALMGTTATETNATHYVEPVTTSDSINTATATWDVVAVAPGRPTGAMLYGNQGAAFQTPVTGPDGVTPVVIAVTENVHMILGEGWSSLYVDTTLVWRCLYHSDDGEANALYVPSEWTVVNAAVSGTAVDSGVFDVVDANTVYVVVNGTRRILIDLTAMEITVSSVVEEVAMPTRAEQAGSLGQFGATLLLAWDPTIEDYRPFAQLTSAGVFNLGLTLDNTLNQAAVEALWQT